MEIKFDKLIKDVVEFDSYDRTNPYVVCGLVVHTICNYDNKDMFYDMLSYLMGPKQDINPIFKQRINDRMIQGDKYKYIGKGYFKNTSSSNGYELPDTLIVDVVESSSQAVEDGYLRLDLVHSGADSKRQIMLRKAKDNNWYLWSDSVINLLVDVRVEDDFWV